jgi:hypothetical protein
MPFGYDGDERRRNAYANFRYLSAVILTDGIDGGIHRVFKGIFVKKALGRKPFVLFRMTTVKDESIVYPL